MAVKAPKRVGIVVAPAQMYCRHVVRGIAAFGAEAGWQWLLVPTEAAPLLTARSSAALDGVIGYLEGVPTTAALFRSELPVVDFSYAPLTSQAVRIWTDDLAVGRLAAAHLLSLGLVHYGFFGLSSRDESRSRQQGFTETLTAAGLSCELLLWPEPGQIVDDKEEPSRKLVRWVAGLSKPAGVFAWNDCHAMQLQAACRELQLAVPDSVAILGVENDELFCELANPAISSIALSTQRIGYEAARMLERLMRKQFYDGKPILIPPAGVVPRASTARPAIVDQEVAAAVRYIAMHVQDNLQVGDVLREVLVSRRSLDQRFLKALGRTPAQEIARAQVEIAKQALAETTTSMELVATMAGFRNAKQLGATFRAATGVTPTVYRQRHRLLTS